MKLSQQPAQPLPHPAVLSNPSYIMSRLDAYLPTLNTGMMDVRVQDAILNYPIVRSLLVPECDLEARRRCINLITKVLNAATPVLPLILQERTKLRKNNNTINGKRSFASHKEPPIPVLSLDAQTRLMTIISTMAERDKLIRFWINHHINNKEPTKCNNSNNNKNNINNDKNQNNGEDMTLTLSLYLKIKQSKEILTDLADRVQGAICIVFWECWDEIYATLADIVGGGEMELADKGRIFRPSGEAAIYINKLRAERKQRLEQQRRESIINTVSPSPFPSSSLPFSLSLQAAPPTPPLFDQTGSISAASSTTTFDNISTPGSSDSPESLITDLSASFNFRNNSVNGNADVQLIEPSELDYIMEDSYMQQRKLKDSIETFTNLGSSDVATPTTSENLNLRKRIQLMEEGYIPEEKHEVASSIIW